MRLIDADALMNKLQELFDQREKEQILTGSRGSCVTWNDAIYHIKSAPTVDAVEVKHGEWIETEKKEWGIYPFKKKTCSVCDCEIDHIFMLACMDYFDDRDTVFHYCPNCGAKMDGEEKNDE